MALAGGAAYAAGCWGIAAPFADEKSLQSDYEAPMLAQRGVGCICLDMHGARFNWPNWVEVEAEWHNRRAATYWDIPTILPECEHVLGYEAGTLEIDDRPVLEDGSRAYFGTDYRLGNIFLPELSYHVTRIAKAMANRLKTPAGWIVTTGIDLRDGSYDEHALASWQAFLKKFFKDASPGDDSNADDCTFNASFGGKRESWDKVPQFTKAELADQRRRALVDLWLADSYASFVDGICCGLRVMDPKALTGPGVRAVAKGGVDASVLASRKNINVLFTDSHESARILDCAAAAFDKKLIGSGIKLVPGDYESSRLRALKLLPYLDGLCFDYAGLVNERLPGDPAKIKSFDPAFRVIPELAPFMGRFRKARAPVLWIASDPAKIASIVVDSYCITEAAMALDPDCLDLMKFKAVIYQSAAPCASLDILEKLFKYALKGGVVLIDAHNVSGGPSLHGRDNKLFWWDGRVGGKPANPNDGSTPPPKVIKIGPSGKWVYVYKAGFWSDLSQVKALVREYAGIELPDPSSPLVYGGEGCALAIGAAAQPCKVSIGCNYDTAAVFDPVEGKAYLLAPSNGRITLPGMVESSGARVWVVKSYGRPTVLYTDGTPDHTASIDDGNYSDSVLEFKFAEKAYVSSPTAPKSLTLDGRLAPFDYDTDMRVVTITRTGATASARLQYGK